MPSANELFYGDGLDKSPRPKIQVVIPSESLDRPLPALPFFTDASNTVLYSNLHQLENAHDVSPPSATQRDVRDSVVSPLGQAQQQPMPFGQFQRSLSRRVATTTPHAAQVEQKRSFESSPSSNFSHDSDASSVNSESSSETSVETEVAPTNPKADSSSMRQRVPKSPVIASDPWITLGNVQSPPVIDSMTKLRVAPSMNPPRQYAPHLSLEDDVQFQPTCELRPTRTTSQILTRKPTLTRKSSKRGARRQTLASTPTVGIVNAAISRSRSRQLSNSIRVTSPTLSEAEYDLNEQLSSFITDQSSDNLTDDGDEIQISATKGTSSEWEDAPGAQPEKEGLCYVSQDAANNEAITPPPTVPRKSSKRQSAAKSRTSSPSRVPDHYIASQLARGRSRTGSTGLKLAIPEYKRMTEEFMYSLHENPPRAVKRTITPAVAEAVILSILRNLDHLDDLFAMAVLDRGFYRVFKRNELELIKSTLFKMSAPAWEFREIAYPGHDLLHAEDLEMTRPDEEYTPTSYLQLYKRDVQVIRAIKFQIIEKCQSFIRPEISMALINGNAFESARVDDALWRIWTFCKIFGSGKAREEDIVAQMDWLKGGVLVHQETCTFGIMTTDYMNDTFVGAPDCFARGNGDGLNAEQLFDMMELWNCLGVLLQGFAGRTDEARAAGIYDNTGVGGGDIDGEETMLGKSYATETDIHVLIESDEWCHYLLTLGLSVVHDLASPARQRDRSMFALASEKGWTDWKSPVFGGTRQNFLKEATSRVYENLIAERYANVSSREVQRQQSKMRIQKHISELRHHRKNTVEREPTMRWSQERPMSEWSTVIGNLIRPRSSQAAANDIVSHIPTLRSAHANGLTVPIAELSASRAPSPHDRTVAQPLLPTPPPSTVPSNRYSVATSMPSIEEHPAYRMQETIPEVPSLSNHPFFRTAGVPPYCPQHHARQNSDVSTNSQSSGASADHPAYQQHQSQHNIYGSERHENTADKAIHRIVEMGFTPDQARDALRLTDRGDGLRVDRAVELLLSRQT